MRELIKFIEKDRQKMFLEIFLILDQLSHKEDIISFKFEKPFLWVKTGLNDYYRIELKEVSRC